MPRRTRLLSPLDDPGFARVLERLLADQRDTMLPNEHDLTVAAQIEPADIAAAAALWDASQRADGTGLSGLLSATEER